MLRSGQILERSEDKIEDFDWLNVVMREKDGEEIYLPSTELRHIARRTGLLGERVWIVNSFLDFELVK